MLGRIGVVVLVVMVILLSIVPISLNAQPQTSHSYAVTFSETGLPNGTEWSVSLNASTKVSENSSITFSEPNGSYSFVIGGVSNYKPLPNIFSVTVKGNNVSFVIVWVPILYLVTFVESGLPRNSVWNVSFGNLTNTSFNSTIAFKVTNGTYNYSIPDVKGIASSPSNGTIRVKGTPTKVFVVFTGPVNFTFIVSGLPSGSEWSIWINGSYHTSTSSVISVTLPNATYDFLVKVPSGYSSNPSQGKVDYENNLIFIKTASFFPYELIIAVLVVLLGVFSYLYLKNRRKLKGTTEEEEKSKRKT